MNFALSPDQEALKQAARDLFAEQVPAALLRQVMRDEEADPPELWRHLSELGFLGLAIPERHGGQGLGMVELAVVLEEAGRVLLPGPFFSTVAASLVLAASGNDALRSTWLPRIAQGDARATLCLAEPSGRWDAHGVEARAAGNADGIVLDGVKLFCPDAGVADLLLVAARRDGAGDEEGRISIYAVEPAARGIGIKRLEALDLTRRLHEVRLDNVQVSPDAEVLRGWSSIRAAIERVTVALCAEMVGGEQRVLEVCTDYAKTREQFGKPIGVYQAISHKIANMLVSVENSRSLAYYAAWAQDAQAPDASVAASMAKAYIGENFRRVAGDGIQVHGGIGFTWEHDMHLFLRRARASEAAYGDPRHHRELVAQAIDL